MTNFLAPLVGMHFRPPAKILLAALPLGTHFQLVREPDNAYDENAIKVLVASANIPKSMHEELSITLPGMGSSLEDVLAQELWFLGYIAAKEFAEKIAPMLDNDGYVVAEAKLSSLITGKPAVAIVLAQAGYDAEAEYHDVHGEPGDGDEEEAAE